MAFFLATMKTGIDLKLVTKREKTVRVRELGSTTVHELIALSR